MGTASVRLYHDQALIAAPMSADHEIGLKYNVGGRPVGALPDSPNNPIVYQRDWPINR